MAWQLLESSELMCSLTQCNRNAVGSRIPWDSSRPFPQKTRHWFGEKKNGKIVGFVSCPLMHQSSDPFEGFLFFGSGISSLTLAAGNLLELVSAWRFTPTKVAYLIPCIHRGLDQDVAQYVSFLGCFENQLVAKQKQKTAKKTPFKLRSHRVSVASYPSLQLGVQVPSWGTSGPSLHVIGEAYWINEGAGHGSPKHSHKVANFPAKHWINETLEW